MTYNIELDSKPAHNGLTTVMVRLHQTGQKPARVLTDVKLPQVDKYWSALEKKRKGDTSRVEWGRWVIKHPDAKALNTAIENEYDRIRKQAKQWQEEHDRLHPDQELPELTPRELADRFKNKETDSYFDLCTQVLESMKSMAFRTYSLRQTAVNLLASFADGDVSLRSVNLGFAERFQDYLHKTYISEKTKKRLAASSINQYIESLNAVHVEVLRLKGHNRTKAAQLSPWSDTEKLKSKTTYRAKFTEVQIDTLATIKPESKRWRITPEGAFSIWVLSHLLAGIRYGDLMMLRYSNFQLDESGTPTHLSYTMSKTGNVVNLPLFSEVQDLLKRWWQRDAAPTDYLLPYLRVKEPYSQYLTREALQKAPFTVRQMLDTRLHYWNDKINGMLDVIQKEAKLKDKLRMHNARHSFADLARRIMQEDNTITLLDITLMLGQRDPRMVMHYIEGMEKQDASKPMGAVFNRKKKVIDDKLPTAI